MPSPSHLPPAQKQRTRNDSLTDLPKTAMTLLECAILAAVPESDSDGLAVQVTFRCADSSLTMRVRQVTPYMQRALDVYGDVPLTLFKADVVRAGMAALDVGSLDQREAHLWPDVCDLYEFLRMPSRVARQTFIFQGHEHHGLAGPESHSGGVSGSATRNDLLPTPSGISHMPPAQPPRPVRAS